MTTTEPRVPPRADGDDRDPELGAFTTEDPELDRETTTAFDWLGDPPQLWHTLDRVIEHPQRSYISRVKDMLGADGRVSSVESALTLPIRQATPKIEKPDDDQGQTEFVEEALFAPVEAGGMKTPIATFIGQVANGMILKRTFHEKVFTKREDGRVVYKKLAWRPPESCDLWRDPRSGDELGFRQYQYLDLDGRPVIDDPAATWDRDDPNYRTVERPYAFIYTHGKHRDPIHGISDLDVSLWAHEMKMKVVRLWYAFCDGQATPRIAVYGADRGEIERRAKAMATLRGGGVVGLIRKGDENVFDAIQSDSTGSSVFQDMIRWLDNVQSESVMAGHLGLTGGASEGRGSLALSQDASGLYMASRQGVAREIADDITAGIVAPLVAINFGAGATVPRFTFESVDTAKVDHVMQMFNTFATAGTLKIPTEFIHLLMELVAQHLDLPMDRVTEMIEEAEEAIEQGREAQKEADRRMANGEPAPGLLADPEKQVLADELTKKVGAASAVVGAANAASNERATEK